MEKSKFYLSIIINLFILINLQAQTNWPFEAEDEQASVVGTIGETRDTGARFHRGVDLINGADHRIFAVNSGTVTFFNSGGNWAPGSSFIKIGEVYYLHCRPTLEIINSPVPVTVNVGDEIGEMIEYSRTHVHLQENNTNYLDNELSPFIDNHAPEVIRNPNRFPNGYKIYRNGIRHQTSLNDQNRLELTESVTLDNENLMIIYSKIDIAADIEDRRINASGNDIGGRTSPYSLYYQLSDFDNNSTIYQYSLTFDQVPNNNSSRMVFHPLSTGNGVRSVHILTSNPVNRPWDRYFNTLLRRGVDENWANDNNSNARDISEAAYPDDKYRMHINAFDVDFNDNPNNLLAAADEINFPIIIDNFLPYLKKVEVTNASGSVIFYRGEWLFNSTAGQLTFNVSIDSEIPNGIPLRFKAYPTETLDRLSITLDNSSHIMNLNNNEQYWETDNLTFSASTFAGTQLIRFNGADLAGNNLLTNPTLLPTRLADGSWPSNVSTGEDVWHRIDISGVSGSTFDVDFNNGGFCSSNNNKIKTNTSINDCLQVCFQDTSGPIDSLSSWLWEFGDFNNSISNDQNPTFRYSSPGIYDVKLTVINNQGEQKTITKTISVDYCNTSFNAEITASITSGQAPLTVQLNDASTGDIISRRWNISGGGIQYIEGNQYSTNPKISFSTEGSYPVNLTLEGESGETITSNTIVINVSSNSNVDLDVDFYTQGEMFTGNQIRFISEVERGCNQFDYNWTFYDYNGPHIVNGEQAVYTFPVPGRYQVKLCVTDNCGNLRCVSKEFNVTNFESNTIAQIATSIDNQGLIVKKGDPIYFYDISTPKSEILYGSWFWDYERSNGGPDYFYYYPRSGNPIAHTYNEVGTYKVRLYVGENATHFGSFDEKTITVVDEHEYLEIPTIHESYKQTITGKVITDLQTKNFGGKMLAFQYDVNTSEREIVIYKKSNSNWIEEGQINLLNNRYNSGISTRAFMHNYAMEDRIIIVTSDRESNHDNNDNRIEVYTKTNNNWQSPQLYQILDDFETDERIAGYNVYKDVLVISVRKGYTNVQDNLRVYVWNDGINSYERKAILLRSDGNTSSFGSGKIDISDDYIITSSANEGDRKVYIYEKPDIGWINSIEKKVLTSFRGYNGDKVLVTPVVYQDRILARFWGSSLSTYNREYEGLYVFKKVNNDWENRNEESRLINYRNNVEDYWNGIRPSGLRDKYEFSDNGKFIMAQGSPVKGFGAANVRNYRSSTIALFKKSSNGSWNDKYKEDYRLHPEIYNPLEGVSGSLFDEYDNEVTQISWVYDDVCCGTNRIGMTIYTYRLDQASGVCGEDKKIEDRVFYGQETGEEGRNIELLNVSVRPTGSITYKATKSIILKEGSRIQGYFKAQIVECNIIDND